MSSTNRESYQIPSSQGAGASAGGAPASGARSAFDMDGGGATMHYICGDCGTKFPLKRNDPIRCKECGCRVLFKERTKRMVQFEAR